MSWIEGFHFAKNHEWMASPVAKSRHGVDPGNDTALGGWFCRAALGAFSRAPGALTLPDSKKLKKEISEIDFTKKRRNI
jgi:hypothetical protein